MYTKQRQNGLMAVSPLTIEEVRNFLIEEPCDFPEDFADGIKRHNNTKVII